MLVALGLVGGILNPYPTLGAPLLADFAMKWGFSTPTFRFRGKKVLSI